MGSDELIANLFRISQTEQKLINDSIKGESSVNNVHYEVGYKIRQTIKELDGTMSEDFRQPKKFKRIGKRKQIFK